MNRKAKVFFYLLALVTAVAAEAEESQLRSGVFKPPRAAPDFSLLGSDGSEIKLSRYRKHVVALGFGFTSCADVCPVTLAKLAGVRKKLGAAGSKFQVLYITVDPERDRPDRLQQYLANFDPTFIGATGSPEQLADVYKAYGIFALKEQTRGSQSKYAVHHSSFVYLIDREGSLRAMFPFGQPTEDIAHDVKILLSSATEGHSR